MPNSDPFLRPGLTPNTDVELYESAAEGQGPTTPVAVSGAAAGVASVSLAVTFGRQFVVTATGIATVERTANLERSFAATATANPFADRTATLVRSLTATATATAAESHQFISGAEPATYTVSVSATAAGVAASTTNLIPGGQPEPPPVVTGRGGGFVRPAPVPVIRTVHVCARAHGRATVTLTVDRAGRRHLEDELVLIGAI